MTYGLTGSGTGCFIAVPIQQRVKVVQLVYEPTIGIAIHLGPDGRQNHNHCVQYIAV